MDAITTEEREAIDAFMAQRSVTVVAPPAPKRRGRPPKNPDAVPIDERKARAAKRALAKLPGVRDRRRFKAGPIANGSYAKTAPADATGTIYPTRVSPVLEGEAVLKDGAHSSKIGGDVLVGRLRGAKIFTLTLEERATCPRSCRHWVGCYGNAMQAARRWQHGPELIDRLANEVAALCAEHAHVLIRLHTLGDFWSVEYLAFWVGQLDLHDNLTIFGFTAWGPGTPIGDGVDRVRRAGPDRFMIRTSNRTGTWGSFTLDFPTEAPRIGDALVCPEQRDANAGHVKKTHCGSCGACWNDDRPIAFICH
ncbi:MAG: hypothetical protein KDK24_10100 [Pseudooceanicola sp.]|nr:hypothetical protein [Pseudooceanicola sp.]